MPTIEELAAQLEAALDRIGHLEQEVQALKHNFSVRLDAFGAGLVDINSTTAAIRQTVISTKADTAGLSDGQARLETRVNRLDHKVDGLTAKVDGLEAATLAGFETVYAGIGALVERADRTDATLSALVERADRTDATLAEILRRLPAPE